MLSRKIYPYNTLLMLFFLVGLTSCKKRTAEEKELPEIVKPVPIPTDSNKTVTTPPIDDKNKIVIEIVFDGVPAKATAMPAKLKFNKTGWASAEWDDNSIGSLKGFEKLKATFYTDGCGNKIPYTAAVAVNGRNQYSNEEAAKIPNNVTYDQMKTFINAGWDIENHSYYHDPTGNYNFGTDRERNVKELDDLLLKNIQYKLNGLVVPTNYDGFPTAAKKMGYLFSTSQGTFDGFEPAGKPVYKNVQDFDLAPKDFSSFNRMFFDDWAEMERNVKQAIADIGTKNNPYFRFASHGIDQAAFNRIIDNFQSSTADKILFIPTREAMEYRIMSSLPIKYDLNGSKLAITVDITNVSDRVRWRDLSFLVSSDKKITAVNILSIADKVTFNSATGLVNVFKQIKTWQ